MGRPSTGAITTRGAYRIDLKKLRMKGMVQAGKIVEGVLRFDNGDCVTIIVNYINDTPFMILRYRWIKTSTYKREVDDCVYMEKRLSNIGIGYVYYFLCPETNQRCRTLYRCYGSSLYKSFKAYQSRIYYNSQLCSNWNDRFWHRYRKLEKMDECRSTYTYAGKITKRAMRYEAWEEKMEWADSRRIIDLYRLF